MKKIIVIGFIIGSFSSTVLAADDATHPSNNPANVMNTLNQTLPGAQTPTQDQFQSTTNPQYIKHAESVTHKVKLKDVQLLDAKVIPATVKALYQNKIGQQVTFKDIQQLAAQIQQTYRNEGYILVQVILPPQEINIDSGVVQLQVVNGVIKNIIFTGDNPRGAKAQLQRYAEQVEVQDPISYQSIDHFLALANQLPGIDVSATLMPDKTVTGAADLVVNVQQKMVGGFINFNNRGTQTIGPYQTSVGVTGYDLFMADALSLTGATSLNAFEQMKYGSVSYDWVIGSHATEIDPSITQTYTEPGSTLAPLNMSGIATKYNLSVNQPLYTTTQQNLTWQTAFYHVNSTNNIDNDAIALYSDQVTALDLGLNYQGSKWQMYHDVTLSVTTGMPILGTPNTLNMPSVVGAQTSFVHFNLQTSEIHYFTQHISGAVGTQFQYSPNTLVASEQIGYGGQQFGQAFTPYIISGNSGIMGSLALRYDLPLRWHFEQIQPEIFYDPGMVFYNTVPGTNNSSAGAQSMGLGLNLQWLKNINANLVLAKPVSITETPNTNMGWAGFFSVTAMM